MNQISQPQPKTNSSRRRFLQIGSLVVGGLIVAVVEQNIFGKSTLANTLTINTLTVHNQPSLNNILYILKSWTS